MDRARCCNPRLWINSSKRTYLGFKALCRFLTAWKIWKHWSWCLFSLLDSSSSSISWSVKRFFSGLDILEIKKSWCQLSSDWIQGGFNESSNFIDSDVDLAEMKHQIPAECRLILNITFKSTTSRFRWITSLQNKAFTRKPIFFDMKTCPKPKME